MRAITLAAALLALPAAAAAQDPAAPLPLRPAGVALNIFEDPPRLLLPELRRCPRRRGGGCKQDGDVSAPELLSIDGIDVRGWSAARAGALLVGEAGTRATVVWRDEAGEHTLVRARTDMFAPGPGYARVLATRHFVLHFRPDEARRARSLARHAERLYARAGYPAEVQGRRAHYWVLPYGARAPKRDRVQPAAWGGWVTGKSSPVYELGRPLAYVGYGFPGRAADALGAEVGWAPAQDAHRWAARYMQEGSTFRGLKIFFDSGGELSLREYVRERYGDAALGRLWRSDLEFDQAAAAVLGMDRLELKAQWRRDLLALGPNPDPAPGPGTLAAALGWGALILLGGIGVARRREVG